MTISPSLLGVLFSVWFVLSLATIVFLARRKSENAMVVIVWGAISLMVPIIGLIFILYLSQKPDLLTADSAPGA